MELLVAACGHQDVVVTYWPDVSWGAKGREEHVVTCSRLRGHEGDHSHQWGDQRFSWSQLDSHVEGTVTPESAGPPSE